MLVMDKTIFYITILVLLFAIHKITAYNEKYLRKGHCNTGS